MLRRRFLRRAPDQRQDLRRRQLRRRYPTQFLRQNRFRSKEEQTAVPLAELEERLARFR